MSRLISTTFSNLKQTNKKAVIPFLTANFPDRNSFLTLLHALPDHGAHIIEIGIPFSDPMADGEIIQKTSAIAIKNGFSLSQCLADIADFKSKFPHIPIVIMSYVNPCIHFGMDDFLKVSSQSHVDGLLLVDVPVENHATIIKKTTDINMIRLITPTTDANRLPLIQQYASGFIYYVSVKGITGSQTPNPENVKRHLSIISKEIRLPMVIGFGISTIEIATSMAAIADGIVIGSSFLKPFLNKQNTHFSTVIKDQLAFIKSIDVAINNV